MARRNQARIEGTLEEWNDSRISENNLHGIELLGGWPGGLMAQVYLRHKSKKKSYQKNFWTIVGLWQIAAMAVVLVVPG